GQAGRITNGDRVEPAGAAWPAGHRAVFAPHLADALADAVGTVVEFGRKRSTPNPAGVRLDDTDDARHVPRRHARAAPDARGPAVRAGHVGIRAMIDVEQAPLRGLKEQVLASA